MTPSYILMLTGVTAIGAVLGVLVHVGDPQEALHPPLAPLHRESAMVYGATLALLTGTAAAVALTWFPYSLAGWVILTIYVIFRPVYKGRHRCSRNAPAVMSTGSSEPSVAS